MKKTALPDELALESPGWSFENENDPKVQEYVSRIKMMQEKAKAGNLYIKFIDGDRKGSIARVIPSKKYEQELPCVKIDERHDREWGTRDWKTTYRIEGDHFCVTAKWDKRQNSPELTLPDRDIVFLPNYTGPTVWELFDSKAAKAKALKNPKRKDIDGKMLNVGDKVLYVNGSGVTLCHGTIKEFKATADSKRTHISIVIEREGDKVLSTINNSTEMIYKKPL